MSSDKKIVTVFGATGIQGGSVIRSILADSTASSRFALRGITRDVSKPASKALVQQGVEVIAVRNKFQPDHSLSKGHMLIIRLYRPT